MYVRSNANGRDPVRVPENYSGHAFRDQSPYGDMPPPARIPPSPSPQKDKVERQRADEVHFSPVYPTEVEEEITLNTPQAEDESPMSESPSVHEANGDKSGGEKGSSIFSSLLPTVSSSKRFPFGHGLGGEELLILALMLIIYLSDEADEELLILLGFLLFAG